MTGDSITDTGRVRPLGEGREGTNPYGNGYVNIVAGYLGAEYPELGIRVVNKGISGDQCPALLARWDEDVLALSPDWVSILIGINDVWREFDMPYMKYNHSGLQKYGDSLAQCIEKTLPITKNIIVMSPYMVEPNTQDAMRVKMQSYAVCAKETAAKYQLKFVDLQAGFDRLLKYKHPMFYCWDRIHPGIIGHTMIAHEFLKAVEAK